MKETIHRPYSFVLHRVDPFDTSMDAARTFFANPELPGATQRGGSGVSPASSATNSSAWGLWHAWFPGSCRI